MALVTRHLVVHGRVQGVGYRYSMVYAAKNNNITGWVRNRRDGTVEAVAQGEPAAVQAFVDWARRGPDLAEVLRVDVTETDGHFMEFEIHETV